MGRSLNLTGQKIDKLTIIRYIGRRQQNNGRTIPQYECKCDCGNDVIRDQSYLLNKRIRHSCGCDAPYSVDNIPHSSSFKLNDFTGKTIGDITVISRADNVRMYGKNEVMWNCVCSCGKHLVIPAYTISRKSKIPNVTFNCGDATKHVIHGNRYINGDSNTRLKDIWNRYRYYCYNPNSDMYHLYGARGIAFCDEWKDNFDVFKKWALSVGYDDTKYLIRAYNDIGFCPENCYFSDRMDKISANSVDRRVSNLPDPMNMLNQLIYYQGSILTASDWDKVAGFPDGTVINGIMNGMTIDQIMAMNIPGVMKNAIYQIDRRTNHPIDLNKYI